MSLSVPQRPSCNDPLQGGHILAHFKVDVIKQPPDNNFDKTSAQIQVGLNNPKPNAHIHGYTLQYLIQFFCNFL